jgi:hypothetical protein
MQERLNVKIEERVEQLKKPARPQAKKPYSLETGDALVVALMTLLYGLVFGRGVTDATLGPPFLEEQIQSFGRQLDSLRTDFEPKGMEQRLNRLAGAQAGLFRRATLLNDCLSFPPQVSQWVVVFAQSQRLADRPQRLAPFCPHVHDKTRIRRGHRWVAFFRFRNRLSAEIRPRYMQYGIHRNHSLPLLYALLYECASSSRALPPALVDLVDLEHLPVQLRRPALGDRCPPSRLAGLGALSRPSAPAALGRNLPGKSKVR